MKKLMILLAAMLALVLAVVVPAVAQVTQTLNQWLNYCVKPLRFGNIGSNQNAQGFVQCAPHADCGDVRLGGWRYWRGIASFLGIQLNAANHRCRACCCWCGVPICI